MSRLKPKQYSPSTSGVNLYEACVHSDVRSAGVSPCVFSMPAYACCAPTLVTICVVLDAVLPPGVLYQNDKVYSLPAFIIIFLVQKNSSRFIDALLDGVPNTYEPECALSPKSEPRWRENGYVPVLTHPPGMVAPSAKPALSSKVSSSSVSWSAAAAFMSMVPGSLPCVATQLKPLWAF